MASFPILNSLRRHGGLIFVSVALLLAILVPFGLYEEPIQQWFNAFLRSERAAWIITLALGGALAADILLPVPSSLVNIAAGVLLGFWTGTLVCWLGLSLGCLLGYLMGSKVAHRSAERVIGATDWERLSRLTQRYGFWMIALCRPVPVLAEASLFVAGMLRMPIRQTLGCACFANLGVAAGYAAVGAYALRTGSFLFAFAGAIALPWCALLIARRFEVRAK